MALRTSYFRLLGLANASSTTMNAFPRPYMTCPPSSKSHSQLPQSGQISPSSVLIQGPPGLQFCPQASRGGPDMQRGAGQAPGGHLVQPCLPGSLSHKGEPGSGRVAEASRRSRHCARR